MKPEQRQRTLRSILPLLLVSSFFFSACSSDNGKNPDVARKKKGSAQIVEVAKSETRPLKKRTTRTGTLQALHEVKIFNQEEGQVREVRYYPGDYFKKNDILIQLDDSLLRAQLDKATASRLQAAQDLRRLNSLVAKKLAAEDERARAETAFKVAQAEEALLKTRLSYTVIRAPFAGTATERLIEPGDIAPRYKHLLTIIDPRTLLTHVEVSELLLAGLSVGDEVKVKIDALPDQELAGVIRRIYPTINQSTRKGTIEVFIKDVPQGARAGQFCRVIMKPPRGEYLIIPFSALRRDEKGEFVYLVNRKSRIQVRYVHTGIRDGNRIVVLDGLKPDTAVVTKGFLGLRSGMAVSVTSKKPPAGTKKATPGQEGNITKP